MKTESIFLKIVGLASIAGFLAGVFLVITVPLEWRQMNHARSWPSRKGEITRAYVREYDRGARNGRSFKAEILGTYQDTGESFHIHRVRYGTFTFGGGESVAEKDVARYKPGSVVDVYYAPDEPKKTLLEPHASSRTLKIAFFTGIGLILFPFAYTLIYRNLVAARPRVDGVTTIPEAPSPPVQPGTISEEAMSEIRAELAAGRKIQAVKLYRQNAGCGLAEAKEAVEALG